MQIYVVKGMIEGSHTTLLVTTNLEKAKAFIVTDGWEIEVWENEVHLFDICYDEEDGFYQTEVNVL